MYGILHLGFTSFLRPPLLLSLFFPFANRTATFLGVCFLNMGLLVAPCSPLIFPCSLGMALFVVVPVPSHRSFSLVPRDNFKQSPLPPDCPLALLAHSAWPDSPSLDVSPSTSTRSSVELLLLLADSTAKKGANRAERILTLFSSQKGVLILQNGIMYIIQVIPIIHNYCNISKGLIFS